ncbi:unnamed protein product [Danaus chrysippus]|uniref:(African queen) hypothetical protein n=1 Tax=Danaus chrysippus TaxID=151541 RepID=A0A8J2QCE6_9NEOP|nr:unnamed protein product [Danaus chrysippus]
MCWFPAFQELPPGVKFIVLASDPDLVRPCQRPAGRTCLDREFNVVSDTRHWHVIQVRIIKYRALWMVCECDVTQHTVMTISSTDQARVKRLASNSD